MRAITLWQPWASAIALGLKTYETRGWSTKVRGPILIHAAKRWTPAEREFCSNMASFFNRPDLENPSLGAIVAMADITSVHSTEDIRDNLSETELAFGNYEDNRFAWGLENIRAFEEPIPYKGGQGFFKVPSDIVLNAAVKKPLNIGL